MLLSTIDEQGALAQSLLLPLRTRSAAHSYCSRALDVGQKSHAL